MSIYSDVSVIRSSLKFPPVWHTIIKIATHRQENRYVWVSSNNSIAQFYCASLSNEVIYVQTLKWWGRGICGEGKAVQKHCWRGKMESVAACAIYSANFTNKILICVPEYSSPNLLKNLDYFIRVPLQSVRLYYFLRIFNTESVKEYHG